MRAHHRDHAEVNRLSTCYAHPTGFERVVPTGGYAAKHSFFLVRQVLGRGALVVLMRSRGIWFDAVPELATYPRLFQLCNPQNPAISQRNCPSGFDEIVNALTAPGNPTAQ